MTDQFTIPNQALVVKRTDNGNLHFVVRWNLLHRWKENDVAKQQSRFPGPDDYCEVTIS